MTNYDLRIDYKRDTGLDADTYRTESIELDDNLTILDLRYPIEMDIDMDIDNIPYVNWLEEQLIKLQK